MISCIVNIFIPIFLVFKHLLFWPFNWPKIFTFPDLLILKQLTSLLQQILFELKSHFHSSSSLKTILNLLRFKFKIQINPPNGKGRNFSNRILLTVWGPILWSFSKQKHKGDNLNHKEMLGKIARLWVCGWNHIRKVY